MEKNKIFYWPLDVAPVAHSLRLQSLNSSSMSLYSGSVKSLSMGKIWVGSYTFPSMGQSEAHKLQSFLDQVGGPSNIIRMIDWTRRAPLNLGRDTLTDNGEPWSDGTYFDDGYGWSEGYSPLLISSANQGDTMITVDGLPASTTVFQAGDNFELNQVLYNIVSDATTNASGQVTIEFQRPLLGGAAIGDPLILNDPRCNMRLTESSDDIISHNKFHGEPFTISLIEDIK